MFTLGTQHCFNFNFNHHDLSTGIDTACLDRPIENALGWVKKCGRHYEILTP